MARRKKTQIKAEQIQLSNQIASIEEFEGGRVEYYLTHIFASIRENIKEVLIVVATIMLLITAAAVYSNWQKEKEKKALIAFETLMEDPIMSVAAGTSDEALKRLEEYEKKYTDERSRFRGSIKKIQFLAQANQKKEAAELSKKLADELEYPDERAYFYLQAAILFENEGDCTSGLANYAKATELITKEGYAKAVSIFGEGRCLVETGKKDEGRKKIEQMIQIKEEGQVSMLRLQGAAYLLKSK